MSIRFLLFTIATIVYFSKKAYQADPGTTLRFLAPLTLITIIFMALALLRDAKVKKKPTICDKDTEKWHPSYLIIKILPERDKYIRKTIFNPRFTSTSTILQIFFAFYLVFFIATGTNTIFCTSILTIEAVFTLWKCITNYTNWSNWHKSTTQNQCRVIVNKYGIAFGVPHKYELEVHDVYTNANEWKYVKSVEFAKNAVKFTVGILKDSCSYIYIIPESEKKMEELKFLVAKHFPANKKEKLTKILTAANANDIMSPLMRTAIRLEVEVAQKEHLSESYFGYLPALPPNIKWPTNHGLPLSFLCQINCADLAEHDDEHLLPNQGRLLFFYEMKEMLMNEKGNNGCVRVIYNNSPVKDLVFREDFIQWGDDKHIINHYAINFNPIKTFPLFDDARRMCENVNRSTITTYNSMASKMLHNKENLEATLGSLLGYSSIHSQHGLIKDDAGKDYVLLLQMTLYKDLFWRYLQFCEKEDETAKNIRNFYNRRTELPCILYFYVPKEDLKRLDFSNMIFVRRSETEDKLDEELLDIVL